MPDPRTPYAGTEVEEAVATPTPEFLEDRARLRPGDRLAQTPSGTLYILRDAAWEGSAWSDAVSVLTLYGYGVRRFKNIERARAWVASGTPGIEGTVEDVGDMGGVDDPRESAQEQADYRRATEM